MKDKYEIQRLMALNIDTLDISEREREIIKFRFGVDNMKTVAETGKKFGISKQRVSQIINKVLSNLT